MDECMNQDKTCIQQFSKLEDRIVLLRHNFLERSRNNSKQVYYKVNNEACNIKKIKRKLWKLWILFTCEVWTHGLIQIIMFMLAKWSLISLFRARISAKLLVELLIRSDLKSLLRRFILWLLLWEARFFGFLTLGVTVIKGAILSIALIKHLQGHSSDLVQMLLSNMCLGVIWLIVTHFNEI